MVRNSHWQYQTTQRSSQDYSPEWKGKGDTSTLARIFELSFEPHTSAYRTTT